VVSRRWSVVGCDRHVVGRKWGKHSDCMLPGFCLLTSAF